ncbi:class I SAM-dependent methyltransferase [Saccharothrix sp. ST-888]|uniref:class I SAM-dependent methyltransferase n=1 Tax=Saccharothrix sp. ST-888 TaxID=1427391 RepID=UPI0005EC2FEE|nr:class I SAM-dependent methyltransferase [Saccharothrix sp. ST-888]KJK57403.1 methyltransferase type 11 [Saccharothrix sp. ST-888]
MPIDFHSEANRLTYTQRRAGADWAAAIRSAVAPERRRVADIGCGGGVYCAAWLELGAASVAGVDFSAAMISAAREHCADLGNLTFSQGSADRTGLPDTSADIVFERALVHHLDDPAAAFREARRVLAPGGTLIVQDRTVEDVRRPGSASHLRGWFFERFPGLLDVEAARRPSASRIEAALRAAGFGSIHSLQLAEVRREYTGPDEVRADLLARTGRSILHELTDPQLADLADYITARLPQGPIREQDHWTIWVADS